MSAFADINVSAFVEITGQRLLTLSRRISRQGDITLTFAAADYEWASTSGTQPQLATQSEALTLPYAAVVKLS